MHVHGDWNKNVHNSIVFGGGGGLAAKSCDSWNPVDYSLPGSAVHGILQARILEWVARLEKCVVIEWNAMSEWSSGSQLGAVLPPEGRLTIAGDIFGYRNCSKSRSHSA